MKHFTSKWDLALLVITYGVANLLFVLNYNALYWDDWVAFNHDSIVLKVFFDQIQHGIKGEFVLLLNQLGNGILPYRLFAFFATLLNGIFIYLIGKSLNTFSRKTVLSISILFLLAPLNHARYALSITPFLFPVFLFYLGFYLLTVYHQRPKLWLRGIILLLFLTSFSTNSVLVFYATVFIYIYYFVSNKNSTPVQKNILLIMYRYADFIVIPFAYFIYKTIYMKPYGLYEGYNAVRLDALQGITDRIFFGFKSSFIGMFPHSVVSGKATLFVIVTSFLIAKFWGARFSPRSASNYRMLLLGISFFILGIFPYCAVGKIPVFDNWDNRLQLLLPLGIAFMIYSIICIAAQLFKDRNRAWLVGMMVIIGLFMVRNAYDGFLFLMDNFYQISVQENLKSNETIRNNTTFLIKNEIKQNLVYHRDLSFYEWTGMTRQVFGDEKRFLVNLELLPEVTGSLSTQKYRQYNFYDWVKGNPYLVTIENNKQLNSSEKVDLLLAYLLRKKDFAARCKELTHISVIKYDSVGWPPLRMKSESKNQLSGKD